LSDATPGRSDQIVKTGVRRKASEIVKDVMDRIVRF
jgi:hypothetical protein